MKFIMALIVCILAALLCAFVLKTYTTIEAWYRGYIVGCVIMMAFYNILKLFDDNRTTL